MPSIFRNIDKFNFRYKNRLSATADHPRKNDVAVPAGSTIHQSDPCISGASVSGGGSHGCRPLVGRVGFHRPTCEKAASLRRQIKVSVLLIFNDKPLFR